MCRASRRASTASRDCCRPSRDGRAGSTSLTWRWSWPWPVSKRATCSGKKAIAPWLASAIARRALEHENAYATHSDLFGADPQALAAEVLRQHSRGPANAMRMSRLLVIFADLTGNFFDAMDDDMLESQRQEPRSITGPLVVFDTLAMGARILETARRPLVRVSNPVPFEAFGRPARVMTDRPWAAEAGGTRPLPTRCGPCAT